MKIAIPAGTTSKMMKIFVRDTSKTDGSGLTGLAYNSSNLKWYYIKDGDNAATQVTLATATLGTFTSGGFVEVDATNMPGIYEIGVPNAAIASGNCHMILRGATNMCPVPIEIQTDYVPSAPKSNVKKNQALSSFEFIMTDSTNHAPATGKTVTVTRSIDGGAFAAGSLSAVTEVSNGIYAVNFAASDLNGNCVVLRATATGCDDTFERIITQP